MSKTFQLGEFEELVLLSVLRLGEGAYGTSIIQEVEAIANKDVSLPAVYTVLGRLEEKDYLASELGESTAERGGRAKRYFNITPAGEQALRLSLEDLKRRAAEIGKTVEAANA